jgi:hypothetical protein
MYATLPTDHNGKSVTVAMTGFAYAYGMRDDYAYDFGCNTIDAPLSTPKGSVACSSVRASQWQAATIINIDRY